MVKDAIKYHNFLLKVSTFLLVFLWVYAAFSKLFDWEHFKWELHNQLFTPIFSTVLAYAIPMAELAATGLLLLNRLQLLGLYLSFMLLASFTLYIALVISGVFNR